MLSAGLAVGASAIVAARCDGVRAEFWRGERYGSGPTNDVSYTKFWLVPSGDFARTTRASSRLVTLVFLIFRPVHSGLKLYTLDWASGERGDVFWLCPNQTHNDTSKTISNDIHYVRYRISDNSFSRVFGQSNVLPGRWRVRFIWLAHPRLTTASGS